MRDQYWRVTGHQKDLVAFQVVFTAVGIVSLKAGNQIRFVSYIECFRLVSRRLAQEAGVLQELDSGWMRLFEPLVGRRMSRDGQLLYECVLDRCVSYA